MPALTVPNYPSLIYLWILYCLEKLSVVLSFLTPSLTDGAYIGGTYATTPTITWADSSTAYTATTLPYSNFDLSTASSAAWSDGELVMKTTGTWGTSSDATSTTLAYICQVTPA